MLRSPLVLAMLAIAVPATAPSVDAAPKKKQGAKKPPKRGGKTPEEKEADKHFKSGVALFNEQKYAEALAEFERAYELAPAPIVLLNMAACHRELSHYSEAVKFYNRFLDEGQGKVDKARLAAAKTDLDGVLARIARVTVTVTGGDGATLTVDGNALGTMPVDMPLILAPGEHKLVAHLDGKRDAEKTLRVASGDTIDAALALSDLPPPKVEVHEVERPLPPPPPVTASRKHFRLGVGFGTNLSNVGNTGAPDVGLGLALGSRIELGVDVVLVAYAVMPSLRLRLAGDRFSIHLIGAVPVNVTNNNMSETFVAYAGGLGLRLRATPTIAFVLESYASFATKGHGTTYPAFGGAQIWF